jgi:hypothetical protein
MLMTRTEAPSRLASASVTTRTALVGWSAWCLFILSAGIVAAAALLDRYRGYCPGPGETGRDWAFELFPFGQTCVVAGMETAAAPMMIIQTAAVSLLLIVALAATVVILAKSRGRRMTLLALSLIVAQLASVVLAGVVLLFQLVTNDAPPPLNGVELGLVWNLLVALGATTAITAIAFGITTLVKLGKDDG